MLEKWMEAIETQAFNSADFLSRFKMMEILQSLRTEYSIRPLELVRKRNIILATERRVVTEAQVEGVHQVMEEDPRKKEEEYIRNQLRRLHMLTQVFTLHIYSV
jgi:hypothetical protein